MRTACVLRRSWSQLHRISLGTGSNFTPLRGPQIFIFLGERFFSAFSVNPLAPQSSVQSFSVLAPSKFGHFSRAWHRSAYQEGSSRCLPSELHRISRISCRSSDDEDRERNLSSSPNSASSCNSKWENEPRPSPHNTSVGGGSENGESTSCESPKMVDGERRTGIALANVRGDRRKGVLWESLAHRQVDRRVVRGSRLGNATAPSLCRPYSMGGASTAKPETPVEQDSAPTTVLDYSQRAVVTALWCNFLVFSLKSGVWIMTSSHVMLAEAIHSLADLANQGLIAYGLISSRRAPDAMHPYGYTKERFVWSLISAVGIFCLGSGATIIHGVQNLWNAQPLENTYLAALVIGGSMVMEGASLLVAISCVRKGAQAEGMTLKDYLWRGHDPTAVAVMMEDGAAVTGLAIAALALTAAHYTGNPMWDPIGSIVVGNLLGAVAIFLIQRNRHALLGRSMDNKDMMRVLDLLCKDPVVDAIYDCKSEVIGPGAYRFKAEIDFNGVTIVQNYIQRAGRGNWHKEFQDAVSSTEPGHLDRVMAAYGEEVVSALGSEVDRLEREIQRVVPGIRHVDIEAHNPKGPAPRERLYLDFRPREI